MLKWEEEEGLAVEEGEQEGEDCHTFIKIVYFGKPQTGKGVVSKMLAHLLKNAGDIIGI